MNRKLALLIFLIFKTAQLYSQGVWTSKAPMPVFLEDAFSFTLQGNAYIGTGNQTGTGLSKTFWKYNPSINTWTQMANFGGVPRRNASAVAFATLAFAGLGQAIGGTALSDWWQYDALNNSWIQKNQIPAFPREGAPMVKTGTEGLVFSGKMATTFITDIYKYQSQNDTWSNFGLMGCSPRYDGVAVALNQNIYFGLGYDATGTYNDDWWKFNPISGTWIQMSAFTGGGRKSAVAFEMNGLIYGGTGEDQMNICKDDFYRYDPTLNTWSFSSILPGPARKGACVFPFGTSTFITGGIDNSNTLLNDTWKFEDLTSLEFEPDFQFLVYVVSKAELKIFIPEFKFNKPDIDLEYKIYSISGQQIMGDKLLSGFTSLNISNFKNGIYSVMITYKNQSYSKKVLIN